VRICSRALPRVPCLSSVSPSALWVGTAVVFGPVPSPTWPAERFAIRPTTGITAKANRDSDPDCCCLRSVDRPKSSLHSSATPGNDTSVFTAVPLQAAYHTGTVLYTCVLFWIQYKIRSGVRPALTYINIIICITSGESKSR